MVAVSLLAKQNCLKNKVSKRIKRTAGRDLSQMLGTLRSKKQILLHNQESGKFKVVLPQKTLISAETIPSSVLHLPSNVAN